VSLAAGLSTSTAGIWRSQVGAELSETASTSAYPVAGVGDDQLIAEQIREERPEHVAGLVAASAHAVCVPGRIRPLPFGAGVMVGVPLRGRVGRQAAD
jgi:hypothetical protein